MNPLIHLKTVTLRVNHIVLLIAVAGFLCPSFLLAASVHALFGLSTPPSGPFPSDHFTVSDQTQNTGLRIALPKPDCAARPSDCVDLDVINELDGFNLQPRLSVPFDGPIEVASVTSESVFLVSLGSTLPGGDPGGHVVGINQVVWDTFTNTLDVEADEFLDQHTGYALLVTKNVLGENGKPVKAANSFLQFVDESNSASTGDPALDAYRVSLRSALTQLDAAGVVPRGQVVTASVFTTQSVTAVLEKIRDQIKAATPTPADFLLGPGGTRTVFARSTIRSIRSNRQTSASPTDPLSPQTFSSSVLGAVFDIVPGALGTIAYGKYSSPNYRAPGEYIPAVGSLSGALAVQGTSDVGFILYLPSSPKPAAGYPVAIFGHGGNTGREQSAFSAATMAANGIATIAIHVPGHGFGPSSTVTVFRTDGTSVTFTAVGRGFDQNGDGKIDQGEGFAAAPPRTIQGSRDGRRQTAADFMQLVQVIEVGMDVDGDNAPDLDPSRIYYYGPSTGGSNGSLFLAVEPSVRAGVLNVPDGGGRDRLSPANRDSRGSELQSRLPSLINSPGITALEGIAVDPPYFHENLPLRDGALLTVLLQDGTTDVVHSPVINTVAGALEIQQVIENGEWASQAGVSVAYAAHLRRKPLDGVPAKAVILQIANGDRRVPNPTTTAILRAGDLADRATFVRTNLVFPVNPTPFLDKNLYPHNFGETFDYLKTPTDPARNEILRLMTAIGLQAQQQIASFFALDGTTQNLDPFDGSQITDPDLAGPVFEVPIAPPLPEALNYFP